MRLSSRLSSAIVAGVLLGGALFAGFSLRAQGKTTTAVVAPADTATIPSFLRINLNDSFTQEIRFDSYAPACVATKLQDIDYVITAEPYRQDDSEFLVKLQIKKIVHSTVSGEPSTSEQTVATSQFLTLDGREREIAGFRATVSSKSGEIVGKTKVSLHSKSMLQPY